MHRVHPDRRGDACRSTALKPPPFAYASAATLDDALELLAEAGPDARPIAGGQSLMPLLAYRLARPSHLVDLGRLPDLDTIEEHPDGSLAIGALVRHQALERTRYSGTWAMLREAAAQVGHPPIRARGTLGGSLAHADPAAELPVAMLALDATIVTRSAHGERVIGAPAFFSGPFTTALEPGELVTGVRVPARPPRSAGAFAEFAVRAGDFALAAVAAAVGVDEAGSPTSVRVALGSVAPTPVRASGAENLILEHGLTSAAIREAATRAASEIDPLPDPTVDAITRRELVHVLVHDTLTRVARELAR